MPALYAHNKYGKLVIAKLPQDQKDIIRKYTRPFRIGLQGPDFLFFYRCFSKNKINQTGVRIHHSDTYSFMEHAVDIIQRYGKNSPEYSYILGFICHFALDNACHPYVNRFMQSTGCGHVELEGDLEHLMLSIDGYAPEYYPMYQLIPVDYDTADTIALFYENLNPNIVFTALRYMRKMKKLFCAPGIFKRSFIDLCMRATFHYQRLKGHVITPHPNKKARKSSLFLYRKLKLSVPQAIYLIHNFDNAVSGQAQLSHKFHKDFNGNQF